MIDKRLAVPADYFVGRCQSCRHSVGVEAPWARHGLACTVTGKAESTRPNWQCGRYEYEPGSL